MSYGIDKRHESRWSDSQAECIETELFDRVFAGEIQCGGGIAELNKRDDKLGEGETAG